MSKKLKNYSLMIRIRYKNHSIDCEDSENKKAEFIEKSAQYIMGCHRVVMGSNGLFSGLLI